MFYKEILINRIGYRQINKTLSKESHLKILKKLRMEWNENIQRNIKEIIKHTKKKKIKKKTYQL